MTPRRVAVFTATRADFWPLARVIRTLDEDPRIDVRVLAAGAHLADRYGATLGEIELRTEQVTVMDTGVDDDDSPGAMVEVVARTARRVSEAVVAWSPDLLVVLGDRSELLGVGSAALLHGVPLVHLSGGEITEGATDDAVRHAMTKLSHLHCCACDEYAARVRSMGEEPWRVHVTGEPGIDRLLDDTHPSRDELIATLGVDWRAPVGLLTYHPPTLDPGRLDAELGAALAASDQLGTVIATYPGADPGAARIIERLHAWAAQRRGAVVVESLGRLYPRALASVDVMLGNSSSGIIEAMSFGLPVVNIGDRQRGRARGPNVLDVPGEQPAVRRAVERAVDPAFRAGLAGLPNPYGDGKAAARIVDVVATADLGRLLHKRFTNATRSEGPGRVP